MSRHTWMTTMTHCPSGPPTKPGHRCPCCRAFVVGYLSCVLVVGILWSTGMRMECGSMHDVGAREGVNHFESGYSH